MSEVGLRELRDDDLDAIYEMMRVPEAVRMAAFTAENPDDRVAFDAHMLRIRTWPGVFNRVVTVDGALAGTIASFVVDGDTEITYWLKPEWWGQGIATRALALLLEQVTIRPIVARAASDNAGSLGVLRKSGFRPIGKEVAFSTARGREIEETVLRLDA